MHCLKRGVTKAFDEVDHIIPLSVDRSKRLDIDNLQCLCRSCHKRKTDEDLVKYKEA